MSPLLLWPYIEADFQRDYGIDISDGATFFRMSWRRFLVLYRGLSGYGAVAANYKEVRKKQAAEDNASSGRGLAGLLALAKPKRGEDA